MLLLALVLVPLITAEDSLCGAGLQCVATADCEQLRQLDRSSSKYRQLLQPEPPQVAVSSSGHQKSEQKLD